MKRGHAFGDIGDSLGGRAKLRLITFVNLNTCLGVKHVLVDTQLRYDDGQVWKEDGSQPGGLLLGKFPGRFSTCRR